MSDVGPQEIQDAPPTTLNDKDTSNAYHPFGVSDNDNINPQPTQDTPQLAEPVQWPHRNCRPPKRLIKEMD